MINDKEALKRAKTELARSIHLSECGRNAGIRKMYSDKSDWISVLIYHAEQNMRKEGVENA